MKVKKTIVKDILKRSKYSSSELKLRVVKILIRSRFVDFFNLINIVSRVSRMSFLCNLNDRCFITSRSKSVCRRVRLSRIKFKELVYNGLLVGFVKYSW
jgi:ribosomal protein S14